MAGLLNIGEMGALALHILVELSVTRDEDAARRRTVHELAEALHASPHTLQKVARRLVTMGLVEGARGANGGLRLVAEPGAVTMLQVIEGVDGPICSNGCMFAKRVCPASSPCAFADVAGRMETMVRDYFARTTIADLRDNAGQPAFPDLAIMTNPLSRKG